MALQAQLALRGLFVIKGKEPDGDSIRFRADNPELYRSLQRSYRIQPSRDGTVQLRLEGVDAPELHYGDFAQPLGDTARDALLARLGFTHIRFQGTKVQDADPPEGIRGAILTKGAETNGRPVSYALLEADSAGLEDGAVVVVDRGLLERTLNHWLLRTGTSYYTVYTSTPFKDRRILREAALAARGAGLGVWGIDSTSQFRLRSQQDIGPQGQLILPKLFRRGTDYLKDLAAGHFAGNLADWLVWRSRSPTRAEDDRVVLQDHTEVSLSALLNQRNDRVALEADLLDIMFVEK